VQYNESFPLFKRYEIIYHKFFLKYVWVVCLRNIKSCSKNNQNDFQVCCNICSQVPNKTFWTLKLYMTTFFPWIKHYKLPHILIFPKQKNHEKFWGKRWLELFVSNYSSSQKENCAVDNELQFVLHANFYCQLQSFTTTQ